MAPTPVEELALLDLERSNKGASKQRRDQINGEISTMRDLLPLPESARQRLSQLQIMSLSCVYIRKCNILQKMLPSNRCSIEVPCEFSSSLTGFILVTTRDGKLVYISENVTEYLGHSMVDMKTQGDSLFDIVDKRDHGTVQAQLLHGATSGDTQMGRQISFFCRMNMSRTLKRQGGFGDVKVMHVKGHFVPVSGKETGSDQHVFTALCCPLITPDVKESLIQNNTMVFKSVHKLDMSFIEITDIGEFHLGMTSEELESQSWYSMLHPEDLSEARTKHMQLIKSRHEMGCMMTVRMLTRSHDVIWVNIVMHVKQAFVANSEDPVIVCINQVVSEDEADQFKSQGQLLAMFAARTPDVFFAGPHFSQIQQEMLSHQQAQAYMHHLQQQPQQPQQQQHIHQGFFATEQQPHIPYGTHPSSQTGYGHQNQYMASVDAVSQQPQGHTSTIRALKRKLQENFISSCKPTKISRVGSVESEDGGFPDFQSGGDNHYVMNVDVFRSTAGSGHVMGNTIVAYTGETLPMIYQQASHDPVLSILQKKAVVMNARGAVSVPAVVQKLPTACTLEQVVPEVTIPDCYLTPDPSPATSPKPAIYRTALGHDTQQIKQLTSYVMGRLNELNQHQTISETPFFKTENAPAKRKNLPVIDATFVDTFFDEIIPHQKRPETRMTVCDIKAEPRSPEPVVSTQTSYLKASVKPPPPAVIALLPPPMCGKVKEELTLEDCTDLEEFLGLAERKVSDFRSVQSPASMADTNSPVASPSSSIGNMYVAESMSPMATTFGLHPIIMKQGFAADMRYQEMSPCSASPGYDCRDDVLDPDDWLMEPISLSLDMSLGDLDSMPVDVKPETNDDDICHLKQLLPHSWEPCGSFKPSQ